jgi:DNA-binding PadR family transcriptional regulator
MIPLYVLGLLMRYGPMHGYQLKKTISEELEDFTQIKLPSIYYHLEGMEKSGLLSANSEKSENRPEKTVYTITEKGRQAFRRLLEKLLNTRYRPVFDHDAIFYFANELPPATLAQSLEEQHENLRASLKTVEKHRNETIPLVPASDRPMVEIIFSHHEHHLRAELDWVEETQRMLKEQYRNDEAKEN